MSAPPLPGDMKAGFIGLAFAVVFLFVILTTITVITNRITAHHPPEPAAEAGQH